MKGIKDKIREYEIGESEMNIENVFRIRNYMKCGLILDLRFFVNDGEYHYTKNVELLEKFYGFKETEIYYSERVSLI